MAKAKESRGRAWGNRRKDTPTRKEKEQRSGENKTLFLHKVGTTASGNILVEMTPGAWENICSTGARDSVDLGVEIREFRNRHKISQTEFAQLVGHCRNWISLIERDKGVKLSYGSLKRILSIVRG